MKRIEDSSWNGAMTSIILLSIILSVLSLSGKTFAQLSSGGGTSGGGEDPVSQPPRLEESLALFNREAAAISEAIGLLFPAGLASNRGISAALQNRWATTVNLINSSASAALARDLTLGKELLGQSIDVLLGLGDFLALQDERHLFGGAAP